MIFKKKLLTRPCILIVLFSFFAFFSVVIGVKNAAQGSIDCLWPGAVSLRNGMSPHKMGQLSRSIQTQLFGTYPHAVQNLYPNPPSTFAIILPFSFLSWTQMKWVWALTNLIMAGALLGATFKMAPQLPNGYKLGIILLFLCGTPFRTALGNGQLSLFALGFSAMAMASNRPVHSAFSTFLGLSKPHLTAPLFGAQLAKKELIGVAIGSALHILVTVLILKLTRSTVQDILMSMQHTTTSLHHAGWIDLSSILPMGPLAVTYALTAICHFGWFFWVVKKRHELSKIEMIAPLSVLTVLGAYHRIYDFIILIFPLVWLFTMITPTKKWGAKEITVLGWILMTWFGERALSGVHIATHLSVRWVIAGWGWISLAIMVNMILRRSKGTFIGR